MTTDSCVHFAPRWGPPETKLANWRSELPLRLLSPFLGGLFLLVLLLFLPAHRAAVLTDLSAPARFDQNRKSTENQWMLINIDNQN